MSVSVSVSLCLRVSLTAPSNPTPPPPVLSTPREFGHGVNGAHCDLKGLLGYLETGSWRHVRRAPPMCTCCRCKQTPM